MLEMHTTDEFAAWFDALEDGIAEEVACAMEMVEKLGPERNAPGSSEWLLWYEQPESPEFVVLDDDWPDFQDSIQEMVARLESPQFATKLRALARDDARRVMVALERLKMASAVRRRGLAMLVAGAAARSGQKVDPSTDPFSLLRRAYQTLSAVTGVGRGDLAVPSSVLRELTVRAGATHVRILYGVDPRRNIALAVLGEQLDRSFYGDSVRHAERVWKQFLESQGEAHEPLPR